jgi:uncharacterized repeat protein (TIGR01451 family)
VVNKGVGDAVASDFQAHIDGTQVSWFDATTVVSGAHQVSETLVSGYYASAWGGDCEADGTITVTAGEAYTCTITNTIQMGELAVMKVLVPPDDPGLFDLEIDSTKELTDASHYSSTGWVTVVSGTHTVGESAGTNTNLDDYGMVIACRNDFGTGPVVFSSTDAGPLDVTVIAGDGISCTITNTRKFYTVTLVKELDPTDDEGEFDLGINGVVVRSGAKDGDSGQASNVPVGSLVVVSETLASGTNLREYTVTLSCDVATPSGLNPGEFEMPDSDVTCTYSNTRKPPEMTIDKDVLNRPPVVEPGGEVRWIIVLANTGAGTAYQARIWDTLPTGFTYASTVDVSLLGTASRSALADDFNDPSRPLWAEFTIPPGSSVEIEFIADVADTVGPGTYDNSAFARGINFEEIDDDGLVGQDPGTPVDEDPEPDEDITVLAPVGGFTVPGYGALSVAWLGLLALVGVVALAALTRRRAA